MTDDELIARSTAGEGGAWSWEDLVAELARRLTEARAEADYWHGVAAMLNEGRS